MIALLFLVPLLAALCSFFGESRHIRRTLLLGVPLLHLALVAALWLGLVSDASCSWIKVDLLGRIFVSITSVLFVAVSWYAVGYLNYERAEALRDEAVIDGRLFRHASERVFCGCLLLFLAAMSLVTMSRHFGLLWIALESTTLISAPLVVFHLHERSLEAMWKYLLICSVGIALALLGTFFLAASAMAGGLPPHIPFMLDRFLEIAPQLQASWLKLAFVFIFVGYGTKMGLAPFHLWLPDAHSESPSPVSALLSGCLLNCAFLGLLRIYQVMAAAGEAGFANELLLAFGAVSLVFAAIFVVRQRDYKRMLAYSSVEHMGILALGVGVGGPVALFGVLLHAICHSLAKGMLFMLSGNFLRAFRTKSTCEIHGGFGVIPCTALLWILGFLAITGIPPFGIFVSKFMVLRAMLDAGDFKVAALFLVSLAVMFISMAAIFLRMTQGTPAHAEDVPQKESRLMVLPPLLLGSLVLLLGLYIPQSLAQAIEGAALILGGK